MHNGLGARGAIGAGWQGAGFSSSRASQKSFFSRWFKKPTEVIVYTQAEEGEPAGDPISLNYLQAATLVFVNNKQLAA